MMEISTFFVNFLLNQIQNCSIQIKKMKDGIFSFQLKKNYFCQTFTDDARLKSVPPPLDLTRILKSYHKRNDRRKFSEKQERPIPREINRAASLIKNGKTLFSKLSRKISQLTRGEEARRRGGRQASGFLPSDRYFPFFWLVISTMYVVLFILGKCL